MANNMTPETLRLITDFMAALGAGIGGKGSVGDVVGQQVHNINAEQAAEQTRIRAEERDKAGKSKAAQQMIRLLSGNQDADPQAGKSYGVLQDDAGGKGTFAAQQPVTNLLSILTPDGAAGPTSIAKDKKGNTIIKGMFDPEADVSELNTNDILQTLYAQRMLQKAPKEDQLTDLQIKGAQDKLPTENEQILRAMQAQAGINDEKLVDIGGQQVRLGDLTKIMLQEMQTPAEIKIAQRMTQGDEVSEILKGMQASRNPYVDPFSRTEQTNQAQQQTYLGSEEHVKDIETRMSQLPEWAPTYKNPKLRSTLLNRELRNSLRRNYPTGLVKAETTNEGMRVFNIYDADGNIIRTVGAVE